MSFNIHPTQNVTRFTEQAYRYDDSVRRNTTSEVG